MKDNKEKNQEDKIPPLVKVKMSNPKKQSISLKKWIDKVYEEATNKLYSFINDFEYGALRLIYLILHFTSIALSARFFNVIGTVWFPNNYFVLGIFQLVGAVIFLGFSLFTHKTKKRPYHQLFFLSTSYLFIYGGQRVLWNLSHLNILFYCIVCVFFSSLSFLGIYALQIFYPKLNVQDKKNV
jgi:hypothetical protein